MRKAPKPTPHALKDGTIRWRVRFKLTPGGNSVMESFDTVEEANRFAHMVSVAGGAAARRARDVATSGTVRTLRTAFDAYLTQAASHVSPRTLKDYEGYWQRYLDDWAAWPVEALTRDMIATWVAELRGRETLRSEHARQRARRSNLPIPEPQYLSGKTIANIHGFLSAILNNEVINEHLEVNRAYKVGLPSRRRTREPVFLTQGEFQAFHAEVAEEWQPFVTLVAATGLRFSEATALTPAAFELDSPQPHVRVTSAWKRDGKAGGFYIAEPKTSRGVRTVSLPHSMVAASRGMLEGVGVDSLVFTGPGGGRLRNEWITKRVLRPAIEAAGVRKFGWHDLRHSHASWLISRGISLTVIQRRLGHSSINVTSDVYGHLQPDAWQAAAEATEVMLSGALPEIGA